MNLSLLILQDFLEVQFVQDLGFLDQQHLHLLQKSFGMD